MMVFEKLKHAEWFIHSLVCFRQDHEILDSEFSTECDLVVLLSISSVHSIS